MRRITISALTVLLMFTVAGCGAEKVHGVDTGDPREVASAFVMLGNSCKKDRIGNAYDLVVGWGRDQTRSSVVDQSIEQCVDRYDDKDADELFTLTERSKSDDKAVYDFRPKDDEEDPGTIHVTHTDKGWRVDIQATAKAST